MNGINTHAIEIYEGRGPVFGRNWWLYYRETLRFALYVPIHPFDGFWDLTHERRGSIAGANTITALMVMLEIMRLSLTNFQFVDTNPETFNALTVAMRILLPLLLWVVGNWSLTTLMDGKGKLYEIYMGTAYALTPYVITNAVMIILSQFITAEEGSIYHVLIAISIIWSILLVLSAMMMIHDYSGTKALLSSLLTIVAMGVMVFIFLMFFSLISDAIAYFISLYKEIVFRIS